MQKWYKDRIAKHHKNWDTFVNDGDMVKADVEMDTHNHYSKLLQIAIRNNFI